MNYLKVIIITSLILFPFGELIRFEVGNNISIKPIDVIACLISISLLILFLTKKIKLPKNNKIYFLFPAAAMLSLIINSFWLQPIEIFASAMYLVRWISYLCIFFVVVKTDLKFKKLLVLMLFLDGLLVVIFGLFQFFFFTDLKPLYYLGWDDHMYRLFSVFFDPNFTGALLVLFLLFTCGVLHNLLYIKNTKPIKLIFDKKISNDRLIELVCLVLGLILGTLLFTFSRSSFLMLIIGVSCFLIIIGRKKLILWLMGFLISIVLLISPFFFIENVNLLRQASISARLGNYEAAFTIIKQNPIFGVGFNTYRYAKERYKFQTGWVDAPSHADAGVDNSFIFVQATAGIIGVSAYLLLWFFLIKRAYIVYRKEKNIFAAVFIASGIGIFVHAMFINSLFFPAVMFWMWVLNGLYGE